ncbi:hypothetical protein ACHAWX_007478 [Stephanocyclus meneghinianus]
MVNNTPWYHDRLSLYLEVVFYFVIRTHSSGLPKPRLDKSPPEIWNDEMIAIAAAASYFIWKPFQLISTQNSLKFASTKSYHSKLGTYCGLRAFQFQLLHQKKRYVHREEFLLSRPRRLFKTGT